MIIKYETSDLGCAATLATLGCRVVRLDRKDPKRVIFCFLGDKIEIERAVESFWDGSLKLPPAMLFAQQKILKQRLYGEQCN